ncbi:phosphotransferase family protein [Amycolatopsis sp. 195334CR]|uniref:phosphotransferase family protein n=1 Tax=Amycolatopsis sp. 195334CR TaxID=2814588 RepID=UPI001A90758E|nr:phosphotransferase [Amycolatopsis sp. 195334CR]MBN6034179.1 phosphotransferase [Amycolatopsis sp. 195334CR]
MLSLPADDVLRTACAHAGLRCHDATTLRRHANDVYLLAAENAVAKIAHGPVAAARARRAVTITRWLVATGFPATEPLPVEQPVDTDGTTVTFWRHYRQTAATPPKPAALGALLKALHQLPEPDVALPEYAPLADLMATLATTTVLEPDTLSWLTTRTTELRAQYTNLESVLGGGLIHGDAYPGNLLHTPTGPILGDWDEVATGPRELDLANTVQGMRFGRSVHDVDAFADAYGHDPRTWPGLTVLTGMRDLHTLGSFIRRAQHGDDDALRQLHHRITTLRENPVPAWTAH